MNRKLLQKVKDPLDQEDQEKKIGNYSFFFFFPPAHKNKPKVVGMHFSDKRAKIKEGHLQFLMLIAFKRHKTSLLVKLSYNTKK